jgi:hypothetical protein
MGKRVDGKRIVFETVRHELKCRMASMVTVQWNW